MGTELKEGMMLTAKLARVARKAAAAPSKQLIANYYVLVREEPPSEVIDTMSADPGSGLGMDAGAGISSSNALLLKLFDDDDRQVASLATQRAISLSTLPTAWPDQWTARTLEFATVSSEHAHISDTNLLLAPAEPAESRKLGAETYQKAAVVAVIKDQAGEQAGEQLRAPVFFSSVESRSFFAPLLRLFSNPLCRYKK